MKAVYKNFTLGAIEENIRNLIRDCEIWSDLDVSYEEYQILNEKIEQASNGKLNVLQMQKSYPFISVTHAVNFIIYEEFNDFWSVYSDKLGFRIDAQKKSILGKNWQLILEKVGFDKFSTKFEDLNTMPIMCNVGIPNSEIEDAFYILKDCTKNENFDAEVLIRDLNTWRTYDIGTATRAYMKLHPQKASKFLANIYELINTSDNSEIDEKKYETRILNKYYEWKEKAKYIERTCPNNTDELLPYLKYNYEDKQFSLVVPPYCVKNEYARYLNYKIVDNEQNRYEGKITVRSNGQGRYVRQNAINVEPAKAYVLHCYYDTDETNLVLDKKITGALGYGAIIFDSEGKRIKEAFTEQSFKVKNSSLNLDEPIFENIRYKASFGKEEKPILYWEARKNYPTKDFVLKQLNDHNFCEKIEITKCGKLKASSGEKHFVYLENKLDSGVYDIYRDNNNLYNEAYTPLKIDNMNIFKHREEGYKERVASLGDILVTTLMNYDSIKMLEKIRLVVKATGEKRTSNLDDKSCELLILLISNFCVKTNENDDVLGLRNLYKNAQIIEEIINYISLNMLNPEQRAIILQKLCEYNLSQNEFQTCFDILNLNLASLADITGEYIYSFEKVAQISDRVAMRLSLNNGMDYKQGMKLLVLVGIEAMQEMLQFREKPETQNDWFACYEKFLKDELEKCDYRFLPISKITGEHKEFNDMFNWGTPGKYKAPEIVIDTKVSEGIPFCGQIYLDVLLSWYMNYNKKAEKFTELVKELTEDISLIDNIYLSLSPEIKNSIIFFENALKGRFVEGKSVFAIFYYCGLASVILASHMYMRLDVGTLKICDKFLQKMNKLFPDLVERDLLLADMYVMFNMSFMKDK